MEEGCITVVRVAGRAVFPAVFTLVSSMNPCPCGFHGAEGDRCRCTPNEIRRYRGRLSGPLLDRLDLVVDVPAVDPATLVDGGRAGESSARVRRRVVAARDRQRERFAGAAPRCNAEMGSVHLQRWANVQGEAGKLLAAASRRMHLSARGYDRVRRVARTLADLDGVADIRVEDIAGAIQYRRRGDHGEAD
jgi:magnesium chelatase family protein